MAYRSAAKVNDGSQNNIFAELSSKDSLDHLSATPSNPFTLTQAQPPPQPPVSFNSLPSDYLRLSASHTSHTPSPPHVRTETIYKTSKLPTLRLNTEASRATASPRDQKTKIALSHRSGSSPLARLHSSRL